MRQEKIQTTKQIDPLEHTGFAYKMVEPYLAKAYELGHTMEDMHQVAMIGVLEAAKKYDPEKGAFTTIAAHYIRNEINKVIYTGSNNNRRCREIEQSIPEDKEDFYEIPTHSTQIEEEVMVQQIIDKARLSEREKIILATAIKSGNPNSGHSYGDGGFASLFGVSRNRVRQLKTKAMNEARRLLK